MAKADESVIKVAVVTGGGHGIGRALSRRLARDGAHVVVADIEQDAAETVASEIGGTAFGVDVSSEKDLVTMIDRVEDEVGAIDLFLSNAGVGYGDGESGSASREGGMRSVEDRWATSWNINVMAHVYAARALVPRMIARGGGYLVSVASAAGLLSQIGDAAYSATKHASVAFAESLAITHGDEGIKVSVVCPQAVATRLIGMEDDSDAKEGGFGGNDVDGILSADEVADCVVDGMLEGRFLILPHPQVKTYFQRKAGDYDRWVGGMRKFRRSLQTLKKPGRCPGSSSVLYTIVVGSRPAVGTAAASAAATSAAAGSRATATETTVAFAAGRITATATETTVAFAAGRITATIAAACLTGAPSIVSAITATRFAANGQREHRVVRVYQVACDYLIVVISDNDLYQNLSRVH